MLKHVLFCAFVCLFYSSIQFLHTCSKISGKVQSGVKIVQNFHQLVHLFYGQHSSGHYSFFFLFSFFYCPSYIFLYWQVTLLKMYWLLFQSNFWWHNCTDKKQYRWSDFLHMAQWMSSSQKVVWKDRVFFLFFFEKFLCAGFVFYFPIILCTISCYTMYEAHFFF